MRTIVLFLLLLIFSFALAFPTSEARQQRELSRLMADKLRNSQAVLEGLATANFKKISAGADELLQISRTAEWMVLKTPRYELHSNEFRRAAETLAQKARSKNLDGAALAYFDLTMSCLRCHQYVREVRDASLPNSRALASAPTSHESLP